MKSCYLLLLLPLLILTAFMNICLGNSDISFPAKNKFFFGIANAPSQVEDQLSDIWMDFARAGKIPAFDNYPRPEDRIRFWTQPEIEITLAKNLGTEVFRLGVDWQRIFSEKNQVNWQAVEHYKYILRLIKQNGMKVMLTLFHHTEPRWTFTQGSWKNKKMVDDFRPFWTLVLTELGPSIDYLVTFNEAQIYIMMTQVAGLWPQVGKPFPLGLFNFGPFKGRFEKSLKNMARAHKEIYAWAHAKRAHYPIGIAHNVAYYYGKKGLSKFNAYVSWQKLNYKFPDLLDKTLDFMGINYYGIEVLKGLGVPLDRDFEYSDSGRGIYPAGLYKILKIFDKRYNHIPFIITENGVADANDWFRPLYMTEHLAALSKAMSEGVNVWGYIHWTLTDNFEWGDGYCPKFGLVAVDRSTPDFTRQPRSSFKFFKQVIATRLITGEQRQNLVLEFKTKIGQLRPMCRHDNGTTSLKEPRFVPVKKIDWTFNPQLIVLLNNVSTK